MVMVCINNMKKRAKRFSCTLNYSNKCTIIIVYNLCRGKKALFKI